MEGTPAPRSPALKWSGIALALALLVLHLVALAAPGAVSAAGRFRTGHALALAGGPACLALAVLLAFGRARIAGGLLWLGAAAVAGGLALEAGPRFHWYLMGFLLWVLPQAVAGTLLLLHSRSAPKAKSRPRPKIPGMY